MNFHKVSETMQNAEEAKNRRLVIGAVLLLLMTGGVLGTLFQRQNYAGSQAYALAQNQRAMQIADLTPAQKQAWIDHAKMLRRKWQPWALQHKDMLRKMLRAGPNDEAAMLAVWSALPYPDYPGKPKLGISSLDLRPVQDFKKSLDSRSPDFTWQALGKLNQKGPPSGKRAEWLRQQFEAKRDIQLSRSTGHSSSILYLWASGRITETKKIKKNVMVMVKGKLRQGFESTEGPHREVVPPYDFLR